MLLKSKSTEVFVGEEEEVSDTGLELKPAKFDDVCACVNSSC